MHLHNALSPECARVSGFYSGASRKLNRPFPANLRRLKIGQNVIICLPLRGRNPGPDFNNGQSSGRGEADHK
jgi:hypothetical protein